jgi:hypothetical protein
MPERHYEYHYDYDGRPSTEWSGVDLLLDALKLHHPELDPGIVRPPRAGDQGIAAGGPVPIVAAG